MGGSKKKGRGYVGGGKKKKVWLLYSTMLSIIGIELLMMMSN